MEKLTTGPSSHVWTENGRWFAHITIYTDETCSKHVQIEREFAHEHEAMQWRAIFLELLRGVSMEIS